MNIKNISPGVYLKPNIPTLNLLNTYILVFKKVKISSIFDRNLKIGTMKHILLFIMLTTITACLLTSCKSKTTQSATSQSQMSQSQILEVDDILARADSLPGKTFTTEALCTHICAHGGGKIFLMGSDDTKTIRVEAGTKIGSFKPETVNNLVQVKAQTAEKHGTTEQGCASEQKARGEAPANSIEERITNFRQRIADRQAKEGKNYLSFYYIEGDTYEIVE